MKAEIPSMDAWLQEAKHHESASKIGMYLVHNGVVRQTSKSQLRYGQQDSKPITGMILSYDEDKLNAAIADTRKMDGIHYLRVWLNEGHLQVGDDIMFILIGGDIRPHVESGLQYLTQRIKSECVTEAEVYD